ncbi:hypothetical protein [Effusibacillus consociatus]|uniref:Uncharacterized protein n=1 Tax=Effusibacillus consociatus TaxID=1117041 RepID=A0ABV9Q7B3_9BACL
MKTLFKQVKTCPSCGQKEKLGSIYWKRMGRVDGKTFYQCQCGSGILVGVFSEQHYDALETRLIIEHIITSGSIN